MFTKTLLKEIRKDVDEALKTVGDKYGIDLSLGNISYTKDSFTGKLLAEKRLSSDEVEDKKRKEWNNNCSIYGFTKEDYQKTFEHKGKIYALIGFATSRPKFCVIAKDIKTGKEMLFTKQVKLYIS